ncbi:hypothetical protein [Rhodococcus aetherivorans]|uniref:hypothetical protein n=1 Tax=Rhodococcus aetherivorans TaxID=191292 RepID=UPI003890FAC1
MYNNDLARLLQQIEQNRHSVNQAFALADNQVARQFEQIQTNLTKTLAPVWSGVSQLVETANRIIRDAYPPNWPEGLRLDLEKLEQIAQVEGIPLFYVPRAEIVTALLDASDFEARLAIVDQYTDEIGQDCRDAMRAPVHEPLQDRTILANKAVEAFIAGHYESAQALAVVVCDSYLKTHVTGRYKEMREDLAINKSEEAAVWPTFRLLMPMATAVPFLAEWQPHKDAPAPSTFSRHATIHGASTDQLNRLHATLAIMLLTTMTRALDAGISRYGSINGT